MTNKLVVFLVSLGIMIAGFLVTNHSLSLTLLMLGGFMTGWSMVDVLAHNKMKDND